jgi:hypothetical protein
MRNFLETKVNDVMNEKVINVNWNERCQALAQLNDKERKEAVQYVGTDHVYRFDLVGTLIDNGEEGNFGSIIDIMADSVEEAEQAANDYFVATYLGIINYYQNKAQACPGCSCSFNMSRLYTQEEANEANRLDAEWEEMFSELELGMTM